MSHLSEDTTRKQFNKNKSTIYTLKAPPSESISRIVTIYCVEKIYVDFKIINYIPISIFILWSWVAIYHEKLNTTHPVSHVGVKRVYIIIVD